MKKTTYALHSVAALAVAALATACSSEDELTTPSGVKESVTITAYQPNTRVYYEAGTGVGYWQAGDKIGVILEDADNAVKTTGTFPAVEFTISDSDAGKTKATFTGTPANEYNIFPKYAMYPYNSGHKHESSGSLLSGNNAFTYVLPNSYTYTKVDQDYSQASGNSFCMPMFGTISSNAVTFKNIGGVICMKIDQMPAASGTVTVKEASNQLCGSFVIDTNTPSISTSASTSDNTVTFTYSGATAGESGVFYLPVAVGTYTLTVTVAGEGVDSKEVTTDELNITRSKLKKVSITLASSSSEDTNTINGHKYVDLGLPSGLLWAETNIDAATAADDGGYFAWGETESKTNGKWSTYKWGQGDDEYESSNYTKYNSTDNLTTLEADDDAATANWGSTWRTPTKAEFEELASNCTWTWTSKTNSSNKTISGYEVSNNGNSIFLPASGRYLGDEFDEYGPTGYYWSSMLETSSTLYPVVAYYFNIYETDPIGRTPYTADYSNSRDAAFPIRPVSAKQQ